MASIPTVGSVMTPMPHSIDVGEDIVSARVLMSEHDIRHLPVLSNGKIAGVITDRDIQVAGSLSGDRIVPLLVREACHMPAYVAAQDEPLDAVLEEMAERQLSSVVVVDHRGKLVGIVTLSDVCRLLVVALRGLPLKRSASRKSAARFSG
jgi:acetoin utilization protein AcuB